MQSSSLLFVFQGLAFLKVSLVAEYSLLPIQSQCEYGKSRLLLNQGHPKHEGEILVIAAGECSRTIPRYLANPTAEERPEERSST